MTPLRIGSPLATLALLLAWPTAARGDATGASDAGPADREWVRATEDDRGELTALQTAIARYEGTPPGSRASVAVDLVGAIHVGDRDYYEALNERFRDYEVVLYELVAPEGTVVPRGGRVRSDNPLGAMQNGMSELLELTHQLEHVDYTRPNFVHADMDFPQLIASMKERDEGFLQMYFRMVGQGIAAQSGATARGESAELDLLRAMFSNDRARRMKVTMAGQMDQLEGLLSGFGGERGSTLIHERNRVAMDGVAEQLAAGRKRIAVFYGAGHLEDMDERLRERFGLRQSAKEWIDAWDLRPAN